jgi:hypothetical protein
MQSQSADSGLFPPSYQDAAPQMANTGGDRSDWSRFKNE